MLKLEFSISRCKRNCIQLTSVARTFTIAVFELVFESLGKNHLAADLGLFRVIFFFELKMVTTYLHVKENKKFIPIMPPDLALF